MRWNAHLDQVLNCNIFLQDRSSQAKPRESCALPQVTRDSPALDLHSGPQLRDSHLLLPQRERRTQRGSEDRRERSLNDTGAPGFSSKAWILPGSRCLGGRGGIRTHGGLPHARFRVECLKPDSATLPVNREKLTPNVQRRTPNVQWKRVPGSLANGIQPAASSDPGCNT
jgi:hypothetical protein